MSRHQYISCYDVHVRSTLTIYEELAEGIKREAEARSMTFKETVNLVLRVGLRALRKTPAKPYRTPVYDLGMPREGLDLRKALAIVGELEDDELARKTHLRK